LNHLQRFNTSLIFINVFIALFKTSIVNIHNSFSTLAVFSQTFSTDNRISILVKQLSQHFVNSSLIFGGLFYDNG
jgi:hypothetical protein